MPVSRISRRRFLRHSLYAASAYTATVGLAACGSPTEPAANLSPSSNVVPSTPANAGKTTSGKTLNLYSWATYTNNEEVLKRFAAETGIALHADTYDSNEAMLAKLQASGKTEYSLIYPSDYMVGQMKAQNLLLKLDKSQLPNLTNIEASYLDAPYDPGSAYSIPVSLGTTGLVYNVKAVKAAVGSEPTDWNFLWEHKDKLRITLLNDPREVTGMALHTLGYSFNATREAELKQAFEKLKELKPAIAKFETDAWREQLQAGDYQVCMAFSGDAIGLARQDSNIRYIIPTSGASIWTDTIAIPKNAPNPEAAHAWINFILQPEIAAKMSNFNSFGTTNKAAGDKIAADLKAIAAWSPTKEQLAKGAHLQQLDPKVLQIYDNYWSRLTTGLA